MQHQPHYLRSARRRAALSQSDIAALLGVRAATQISRHEQRQTVPPLLTALAYEAIYGTPVSELFAGMYGAIRAEVRQRAKRRREVSIHARRAGLEERRKRSLQTIAER